MAAYGIEASVYILPNPDSSEAHHRELDQLTVAQRDLTFRVDITTDVYTLYLGPAQRGDPISGLAYVPTIDHGDDCYRGHIPDNATSIDDLPPLNFDIVGFAPWLDGNCSLKFLASAAADKGDTKAMVFYTVTNGNKSAVMPDRHDSMWDIELQGYDFPIYVINGVDGEPLMQKVAEYSGNMTDVWESPNLGQRYDIDDYARVCIDIDTGTRDPLPGLWLFLLIVIGVLIFILGFTSLVMHWIQYRHRVTLRRRLASGEVDLETMGVKRLTVPSTILDKFPLRTYEASPSSTTTPDSERYEISKEARQATPQSIPSSSQSSRPQTPLPKTSKYAPPSPPLPPSPVIIRHSRTPSARVTTSPVLPLSTEPKSVPDDSRPMYAYTQTNCAICIEEFESGISLLRELPCLHIFHAQCIDPHLSSNSSLCPLCKASTLPKGYVPANLTNQTVRRERNMRRMRERYAAMNANGGMPPTAARGWINVFALPSYVARRWGGRNGGGGGGGGGGQDGNPGLPGGGPAGSGRNFSAFASVAPTQEEEDEEWRSMSIWKRLLQRVFPR